MNIGQRDMFMEIAMKDVIHYYITGIIFAILLS